MIIEACRLDAVRIESNRPWNKGGKMVLSIIYPFGYPPQEMELPVSEGKKADES
jgi:hypothetical protein